MSAYKDALHISSTETGGRLLLARELIASGKQVVVIDGLVALRRTNNALVAEVIASGASGDVDAMVETARELVRRSALSVSPNEWLVVEDYGTGTLALSRAPTARFLRNRR